MKYVTGIFIASFTLFVGGFAFASGFDIDSDPSGWFEATFKAVQDGEWMMGAALLVIGLVWVLRKFGPRFITGDRAGVLLALVTATLGGFAHAFIAQGASGFSIKLLVDALAVGLTAIGGYTALKRLVWPKDEDE